MIKGWGHLKFWEHVWPDVKRKIFDSDEGYVFPRYDHWFRALQLTSFKEVRCVILGQDPYPTKGYANGLAFSVYPHVSPLPRSLRNIFTEYENDLGFERPRNGDLSTWGERGVLLLNTILTVEEGKPLSHAGIGWEKLSYEIIRGLVDRGDCAFLLWGKKAQEFAGACPRDRVVSSSHPSPRSSEQGFFGSRPFSRVNEILRGLGQKEINWRLP